MFSILFSSFGRKGLACRAVALAGLAILMVGCQPDATTSSVDAAIDRQEVNRLDEVIVPVETALPERGVISEYLLTSTRVEAENRVDVMAEVAGECMEVRVEEGDRVKAGDVLAVVDKEEVEAQLRQTQVQVRQQKAAYDVAEKSFSYGIGAEVERDNAKFAYEQAIATLSAQQLQLEKTEIRSPIDGIVTARNLQMGQLASMGSPAFSVVDPESFILTINPVEQELNRLRVGQMARVEIDALAGEEFTARIRRINPAADPQTGMVKVILDFDDPSARDRLFESAFARVRLVLETHEDALLIPKDALVEENARKYVFVAEPLEASADAASADGTSADGTSGDEAPGDETPGADEKTPDGETPLIAERVEVKAGLEDGDVVEIVSGLTGDARVITMGQETLKPGTRITVTDAQAEIRARMEQSADEALAAAKKREEEEKAKADGGGSVSVSVSH